MRLKGKVISLLLACTLEATDPAANSATMGTPAPGVSSTNTTKPLSRAEVLAMSPDDSNLSLQAIDPGFQACKSGNYGGSDCQNAMTRMLAKMTQTHQDIVSDLTNVATQLNAIESQQSDGLTEIQSINTAIYGTGSSDDVGLMNQLQTIAQSLQDIQSTVKDQAADIANKSATIRNATDMKIKNVDTIMDAQLLTVQKQINDLLTAQAAAQQKSLTNANNNMIKAATDAQSTIKSNQASIKASQSSLSDAIDNFGDTASSTLRQVASATDTNLNNLKAVVATANSTLSALQTNMTGQAEAATNAALASSQTQLSSALNSTMSQLNSVASEASASLTSAGAALQSDIQQSQSNIAARFAATQQKMQQTNSDNANAIASLSSNSNSGVTSLAAAQQQSGDQLMANAQAAQAQLSSVSGLVSNYAGTVQASVASVQQTSDNAVGPLKKAVGDNLSKVGQASGEELVRMNTLIANLLQSISGDSADATSALAKYISDYEQRAGADAQAQQGALSDTQQTIATTKALSEKKLQLLSDTSNGKIGALAQLLSGSIDDATSTFNDITTANGAQQRSIQTQFQGAITDQQKQLNDQVNAAKLAQQQGFQSLQSKQAQKSQEVAKLIADLMAVLDSVDGASQASSGNLAALATQLNQTNSTASSEYNALMNLITSSGSAANASASGAQAKIQVALSGMTDQLAQSLKAYAGQFNGDLSDAIANLSSLNNKTLSQLQASGAVQANASADADSLAKSLLADLANLQASGQTGSDALVNLFRSQAMQASLDRQVKLKAIQDAANGNMTALSAQAQAMIDQQSGGLAASTNQSVNNQAAALSQLVSDLRAQQIGATTLASQTQGAVQGVEKWISDLQGQIDGASSKVGKSKQDQLAVIQALQDELNTWSSNVDRNISDAKKQLQDGMAMIPQITAAKAADVESTFSASSENMRGYLNTLKAAFDQMRQTEAQYVQQQSLRRLSTLMGIDRASLDNSNVLMQLLGVTDLSQLGDEQQIATTLQGLADGVSALQSKDADSFNALKDQVSHLDSNSKGLFAQLLTKAGGSLSELYTKYAEDQHALQQTISAAADKDHLRTQALSDALSGMLGSIRNGSQVLNTQIASDRKDIYGVDGDVRQLGDDSMISLSRLVHAVQSQSDSADSALATAQRVNADRVATVRDVVISFVEAMQQYVDGSRSGFEDIKMKLDSYQDYLNKKLSVSDSYMLSAAQSTQTELSATADLAQALQNRIEAFNARAKQQLFNVEEERSAIEARHEQELTLLKSKLASVTRQVNEDQDAMAKQVDAWLNEEDADLGFGVDEQGIAPTAPAASLSDAPRTVPDWANDDGTVSSLLQERNIRRHHSLVRNIRKNLRSIHEEAAAIGLVV